MKLSLVEGRLNSSRSLFIRPNKECQMSQRIRFGIAMLFVPLFGAASFAADTKVVISVEKPKTGSETVDKRPFEGKRAAVDVAILLDTSNSMDGLIDQAKNQLWTIVQQFAKAKKHGQTPILRVALFEYGNTNLPASEGYIRQVVPLVDDLDKLSEALFALKTSGGDEYCGQVISEAVKRLDWSKEPNGYKTIFIAGNEPFTQGPVDYQKACKQAIERGIVVNTIHCGTSQEGYIGKWQDGAKLAEGESFNIDQDRAIVHIDCPQDKVIIELNTELNKTYLWYGAKSERGRYKANQAEQDANASSAGANAIAGRASAKAGAAYRNYSRDLVDTIADDKEVLKKVKDEELPDALRKLSPENRGAYVQEMAVKRGAIQKQISDLSTEREKYLAAERKRQAADAGGDTFGDATVAAIRKQLTKSGFENQDSARSN
jgi:hypothetical protein